MSKEQGDLFFSQNYSSLRSMVIGDLAGRIFHKLNNILCIVVTNLEVMAIQKKNNSIEEEIISESRQALRDFQELKESFTFLMRFDPGGVEGKCDMALFMANLNRLTKAHIIKDVYLDSKIPNGFLCNTDFAFEAVFAVLSLIQNIRRENAENYPLNISIEVERDESIRIQFNASFSFDLPQNFLEGINCKLEEGMRWYLLCQLLLKMKAKIQTVGSLANKDFQGFIVNLPLEVSR